MKRSVRMFAIMLAFVLAFQMATAPAAVAAEIQPAKATVIMEDINESENIGKQMFSFKGSTFYAYSDNNISYVSEVTADGRIHFSYILADAEMIYSSDVYDLETLASSLTLSKAALNYDAFNQAIITSIDDFEPASQLAIVPANLNETAALPVIASTSSSNVYSSLEATKEALFQSDYTGRDRGASAKSHDGVSYTVRCKERRITSNTVLDSMWFVRETLLSAVITWYLKGGVTFIQLIDELVEQIVDTIEEDGILKTVENMTSARTTVINTTTRQIYVDGYSPVQYWAAWEKRAYVLQGNRGWIADDLHYNYAHADFDDVSLLMQKGFDNLVNYTLLGE